MTILLVDDHVELLDLWKRLLAPLEATLFTCTTFACAIEIATANRVDIVILDLRLPDTESKTDTLKQSVKLKDLNPACAIIAVTGLLDDEIRRLGEATTDAIIDKRDLASQSNLFNAIKGGLRHSGDTNKHLDMIEMVSNTLTARGA